LQLIIEVLLCFIVDCLVLFIIIVYLDLKVLLGWGCCGLLLCLLLLLVDLFQVGGYLLL